MREAEKVSLNIYEGTTIEMFRCFTHQPERKLMINIEDVHFASAEAVFLEPAWQYPVEAEMMPDSTTDLPGPSGLSG
uniref:Neur_chan_LBD domain-containing protein n=1 Tax=Steinernema glaseri TaxID=37863 RepID=A0A1I7YEP1_9BILA